VLDAYLFDNLDQVRRVTAEWLRTQKRGAALRLAGRRNAGQLPRGHRVRNVYFSGVYVTGELTRLRLTRYVVPQPHGATLKILDAMQRKPCRIHIG